MRQWIIKYHKRLPYAEPIITSLLWLLLGVFFTLLMNEINNTGFYGILGNVNFYISVILLIFIIFYYKYLSTYVKKDYARYAKKELMAELDIAYVKKKVEEISKAEEGKCDEMYANAKRIIKQ